MVKPLMYGGGLVWIKICTSREYIFFQNLALLLKSSVQTSANRQKRICNFFLSFWFLVDFLQAYSNENSGNMLSFLCQAAKSIFYKLIFEWYKKISFQTSHTFYSTNNKFNAKHVKIKNNVKNLQRSKRIQKWMKKSTKISKKSNTTSIISKNN